MGSIAWLPMYFGMKNGIYAKEGLDVQWQVVNTNVGVTALTTGDLDFVGFWGSTVRAASKGVPVRAVTVVIDKPSQFLMVKPEIKKIEDMKGKVLGTTTAGASTDVMMRKVLVLKGIDPDKDLKVVPLGDPTSQVAGLQQGIVDGVNVSPPLSNQLQRDGFTNLLFLGDVLSAPFAGISTSKDKIAKDPDHVKAMIRGTLLSIKYIRQNKAELIPFIVKEYKVPADMADAVYEDTVKTFSKDGSTNPEAIVFDADPGAKPEDVADLTLLRQVQKELGL